MAFYWYGWGIHEIKLAFELWNGISIYRKALNKALQSSINKASVRKKKKKERKQYPLIFGWFGFLKYFHVISPEKLKKQIRHAACYNFIFPIYICEKRSSYWQRGPGRILLWIGDHNQLGTAQQSPKPTLLIYSSVFRDGAYGTHALLSLVFRWVSPG